MCRHASIYVNYYFSVSLYLARSNALSLQFIFANCKVRTKLVSWHGSLWFFSLPTDVFNVILEDRSIIIIIIVVELQRGFLRSFKRSFNYSRLLVVKECYVIQMRTSFMQNKLVFEQSLIFFFGRCWMFRKLFFLLLFAVLSCITLYLCRGLFTEATATFGGTARRN